jgi:hypothetical protein
MTDKQSATLSAALSGRVPVWLLIYPDGSTACVLDRARAEAAALKGAVWVECGPAQAGAGSGAKPGPPMAENARCGSHLPG